MAEYRLSPAAERDLESIWTYTREEWGVEQAERYTDLLCVELRLAFVRVGMMYRAKM
jgi:plasmid stabilization system protein ParE